MTTDNQQQTATDDRAAADVKQLLRDAVEKAATDLHVECLRDSARIRMRVDGALSVVRELTQQDEAAMVRELKALCACDPDDTTPQDGKVSFRVDGKTYLARVTFCSNLNGEDVVIRFIFDDVSLVPMDRVFPVPAHLEKVRSWCDQPNGLILCTGPTGSGKTTVMWSLLERLNRDSVKVISIEHPVYATFNGVCHLNIDPKTGMTPQQAMRVAMRMDPDVVLLSEIKTADEAHMVAEAALTGHVVVSSMHINSAADTVQRLIDIEISPAVVGEVITGIVNQRLVRRLCADCKEAHEPSDLQDHLGLPRETCYRPVGCDACGGSGYKGRLAIFELYEVSDAARGMLMRGAGVDELRRQALSEGIDNVWRDGLRAVREGVTALDEALRVTGGPA
jgi:type II secretory ATPase GspE/PulE/Tfp pilus assembly ATPase PilB-like protein